MQKIKDVHSRRTQCLLHPLVESVKMNAPEHRSTRTGCKGGIKRRRRIPESLTPVHVGHGEQTTYPKEENHLDFLRSKTATCCHGNILQLKHVGMKKQNRRELTTSFCMSNARSLKNKASKFIDFVVNNNLDIVGVCET